MKPTSKTVHFFLTICAALAFTVVHVGAEPMIPLSIQPSNGQMSVSWPSGLSFVQPQKSTNLVSGTWSDFGAATTASNLMDASGSGTAFYRLRFLKPSITQQPLGQTNASGSNVTFTVIATGTAPLTYQWRKDGGTLSGKTGTSLLLSNTSTNDSGNYTVVITNFVGSITSNVAALGVTNIIVRPAGIYMGTFTGEADNGGFGAMVRSNGTAYVVGYNGLQDDGVFAANFSVALNGAFHMITAQGDKTGGTFTGNAVSGNFTNSVGQTGTFSGSRKPDTGIHSADVGYYSGSYSGVYSGSAYIILAADGTAFFFTTGSSGDGGGYGTINSANSFSATTVPDGLTVTGTLNQTTHIISGSYKSGGTTLGSFSVARTLTP
ncbi:MAG TPA: immunoglobulin domain-containing protein [Verrucomicrobiae bacterium]|nr:immunoglobulin domain-containing protein [Verrucomicrobiae bacterium]